MSCGISSNYDNPIRWNLVTPIWRFSLNVEVEFSDLLNTFSTVLTFKSFPSSFPVLTITLTSSQLKYFCFRAHIVSCSQKTWHCCRKDTNNSSHVYSLMSSFAVFNLFILHDFQGKKRQHFQVASIVNLYSRSTSKKWCPKPKERNKYAIVE